MTPLVTVTSAAEELVTAVPVPVPVMVYPPRSTVMPGAPTMRASPAQFRSAVSVTLARIVEPHARGSGRHARVHQLTPSTIGCSAPVSAEWKYVVHAVARASCQDLDRRVRHRTGGRVLRGQAGPAVAVVRS